MALEPDAGDDFLAHTDSVRRKLPRGNAEEFLAFAIAKQVLRFGEFKTKAGRMSPYFFNAGLFNDGKSLSVLSDAYANIITDRGIEFDMLFGPAYKGIPLVSATAVALAHRGINVPFAYNRKEDKDHGEGGSLIGAPLKGRVLIQDDVISAGTSVRESIEIIRAAKAEPSGVLISLDREERGLGNLSAAQEVFETYGIPVFAIATLENLIGLLQRDSSMGAHVKNILKYKEQYGVF